MSDLPGPIITRLQRALGDKEEIIAGMAVSMFRTPLVALLGTVIAIAVGTFWPYGFLGAAVVWVPTFTLIALFWPHSTGGEKALIPRFIGGALLLVVTEQQLLIYRDGLFRQSTEPLFAAPRDGSVSVVACDLVGPGVGIIICGHGGKLRVSAWRISHALTFMLVARKTL